MVSRVISACLGRWAPKGPQWLEDLVPLRKLKGAKSWVTSTTQPQSRIVLSHPPSVCVVLQHNKNSQWCQEHFLNYKGLVRAATVREQLKKLLVKFQVPKKSSEGKNKLPLLMTLLSVPCGVAFLAFSGRAVWGDTIYSGPTLGSHFELPVLVKSCMWSEHISSTARRLVFICKGYSYLKKKYCYTG